TRGSRERRRASRPRRRRLRPRRRSKDSSCFRHEGSREAPLFVSGKMGGMTASPTVEPTSAKVRKFPCPACGADVVWNPGASALKCPYCRAVKELPKSTEPIVEKPIEEALRAPRDMGWGMARKTVKCCKCGAVTNLDA